MKGTCVGASAVDRTRKDGKRVTGCKAWFVLADEDYMRANPAEALDGHAYAEIWVPGALSYPVVGRRYMWSLNQWGRVDMVEELPDPSPSCSLES